MTFCRSTDVINSAAGSCFGKIGQTTVVTGIKCQVGAPAQQTPTHGVLGPFRLAGEGVFCLGVTRVALYRGERGAWSPVFLGIQDWEAFG